MSNQVHQIPTPSDAWLRESRAGETSPRDLEKACKEWMPKGAVPEGAVSHFAHRLMDRVTREAFSADELVRPYPLAAAPVNQSAGLVELTVDSQPADGETIILTVGGVTETWTLKDDPVADTDIQIETVVADMADAIVAALAESLLVVAASTTGATFTLTAAVAGRVGDFSLTGTALSESTLSVGEEVGALDATPGVLGTEWYDATHIYKVVAVTAGVPTWRKIAHSAL